QHFYLRRLLRIVPAYYLALVFLACFQPRLVDEAPWYLAFASNVRDCLPHHVEGPALNLWSIAVEEQFYLVWPLLVLLIAPRRWLGVFAAVALAAPLFRLFFHHVSPDAVVRLTPCRMDMLALGAILGV